VSEGVILSDGTASGLVGLEGTSNIRCTVLKQHGLVEGAACELHASRDPSDLPPTGAVKRVVVVPAHRAMVRLMSWLQTYNIIQFLRGLQPRWKK
jgi:hypothetical protein